MWVRVGVGVDMYMWTESSLMEPFSPSPLQMWLQPSSGMGRGWGSGEQGLPPLDCSPLECCHHQPPHLM